MSKNNDLYTRAIDHWGILQVVMVAEESSELTKTACKYLRYENRDNIIKMAEEFADVEIMKEQMEVYFQKEAFSKLIQEFKSKKLKRLEKRINEYENKMLEEF